MAAKFNVSPATVGRIWQSHRLQPHRIESFKFSTDPQFAAKVKEVVGLDLNPPRPSFFRSTRSLKSKRWNVLRRSYRFVPTCLSVKRTTIGETGQRRCSLRSTHLSVDEIAMRTGFDDPANFRQRFRRAYGVSPKAYRRTFSSRR
jgi:AraC-like DNA-binding protein